MTMSKNSLIQQQQQLSTSPSSGDLSASIDTLPPRRGQDLFGVGGIPIGRSGPTGHQHSRTKSKTDFLDLADSSTRLSNSPEVNARLEQKRAEHERQKAEQKRVFAAQMRALEAQHESEERELMGVPASAPTTPPRSDGDSERVGIRDMDDHRNSNHRQLNQYGNIGVVKTSAFREFANNSKSVPASRRHSGQEEDLLGLDKLNLGGLGNSLAAPFSKNASRHPHKLPNANHETPSVTSFLFDDELESDLQHSTFGGKYLQMNTDDDKFPILVRRDSFPGMLSASSAALDLAPLAQTPPRHSNLMRPTPTFRGGDWSPFDSPNAYRPLPHSQLIEGDRSRLGTQTQVPTPVPFHTDTRASPVSDRGASPRLTRVVHMNGSTTTRTPSSLSGPNTTANAGSTSSHGTTAVLNSSSSLTSPQNEKKSNAFLPPRSPVDMQSVLGKGYPAGDFNSLRSPLPTIGSNNLRDSSNFGVSPYGLNGSRALDSNFGQYGGSAGLNSSIGSGGLGFGGFESPDGYGGVLGANGTNAQMLLNKARARDPETNRFANIRLEDMQGDMFGLCKDQHGCRFLQKKLEEGEPTHRDMIFAEIYPHFGELMTDAFGNYLSQKLLEYSTDEQRDLLIESISGELVSISLNMHGTRAVQKMIDFLSTQRQVQSLIIALNLNVVTLIKDLNGNHVIQKCLNHLPPEDNQFIYNAVAANCIEVATHRHGCCVLQRCIDHASESQRIQLVTEITYNSLSLVQDPFGNYVVQYVLDLNDSRFIEAIVRQFLGNVCALSMQKFSSNVVEKCIRVSDPAGRRALVEELSGRQRLERLLRDSFANYVVQTALDYSDPAQRAQLVDNIRPILPMIRNTPYGKRIQSKIQRESMDPLRGGGPGFHPSMVAGGGYFMAPPHMTSSAHHPHHHHVPAMLDTRSFSGAGSSHQLLSAHHQPSAQGNQSGFPTPWAVATSPVYGSLSLNHEHPQASNYAPFM